MSVLPEKIRRTLSLTDFEIRKLFRQKKAYAGVAVILMLTVLCSIGFHLRSERHAEKEFQGRLVQEFINGISFSQTVLLPAIYMLLPMVLGLFTANCFAGEHEKGLLRTMAIRPVPRWSILTGKLAALVLYSFFLLLALLTTSYLLGALLFGASGDIIVVGPIFLGKGGQIFILNESVAWQRLLLSYFFAGYSMISIIGLFLMFAAIFRKTTLAAVLPLGIFYTSYILDALPFMENLQRFLPTRYLMIWKYVMSPEIDWGMICRDGIFLAAFTVSYLLIAGFVFSSSDL